MSSEPLQIQARLAALLEKAHADARVRAEMARARREFFGSDQPAYVDPADRTGMDVAAQRFAEWFLVERPSEVLGGTPVAILGHAEDDEALSQSRCGLFLVESADDSDVQVRDLEGGERLGLVGVPLDLGPGDVLVGRVYPTPKGSYAPSAVLTVLSRSPQIAVAFQRDLRQLGLDRRLMQIEIEHLVFQRWAVGGMSGEEDRAPLEHIEADLQKLLAEAGVEDVHPAAGISQALREAGEHPGAVMGPLMDELAFHTAVDLDRLRELLLQLSNAHRASVAARRAEAPPAAPAKPVKPAPKPVKPADAPAGEGLGARLARRLDEGLAASEDVDALFRDVERLLGESLDDDDEEDEGDVGPDPEVGDLEPLVREFLWETGEPAEAEILDELVQLQRAAPVPRLSVEYLDADDYLRFVLQTWLAHPPEQRVAATRSAFSAVERFVEWLRTTQDVDLRERLAVSRDVLVARLGELHDASVALSGGAPTGHEDAAGIARVLYCTDGGVELECESGRIRVPVPQKVTGLGEGDLILGTLARPSAESGHFVGDAVALPRAVEHLLG